MRVHFDAIDDAVMPPDKKALIREVLTWYKEQPPDLVPAGSSWSEQGRDGLTAKTPRHQAG